MYLIIIIIIIVLCFILIFMMKKINLKIYAKVIFTVYLHVEYIFLLLYKNNRDVCAALFSITKKFHCSSKATLYRRIQIINIKHIIREPLPIYRYKRVPAYTHYAIRSIVVNSRLRLCSVLEIRIYPSSLI